MYLSINGKFVPSLATAFGLLCWPIREDSASIAASYEEVAAKSCAMLWSSISTAKITVSQEKPTGDGICYINCCVEGDKEEFQYEITGIMEVNKKNWHIG